MGFTLERIRNSRAGVISTRSITLGQVRRVNWRAYQPCDKSVQSTWRNKSRQIVEQCVCVWGTDPRHIIHNHNETQSDGNIDIFVDYRKSRVPKIESDN